MSVRLNLLIVTTALILCTAVLQAQTGTADWPQWRGANRDGGTSTFRPPAKWPETLTMKWRQDVGEGYSTPVVVGDTVYAFGRQAGGDNEVVTAFAANTGKQLWQARYPAPYTVVKAAAGHGMGPKATPAYADGRLFTFGISGILTALDAKSGKILWQKPAPAEGPTFTTSQSPMVDRGLLIVHVGGAKGGALTAFDPATGNPKWQWTGDGPSYGSPIVAELGGVRQVVTFTLDNLVGVSAETGEQLWIRPFKAPSQVNAGTPIVYRDMVIVSGQDAGITAFRVSRQGGKWVTENVWENDALFYRLSNSVIVGNALFGLSPQNRGQFFFIDAATGKTLWTGEPRAADNAAVAKSGNLLLVLKTDGQLIVADGSNTSALTPIRTYKVAEPPTWGAPSFSGNRIFVKDATGVSMWTAE
jgi:outer membrane protein assembly factor BamB